MLHFITRYYSSLASLLWAPFRGFWRLVRRLLPDQDVTAISSGGNLDYYHISTFYRFFKLCAKIALVTWAAWSTYVFVYHRPMLDRRTRQLAEARAQHAQHMSDLKVFFSRYSELHREMNSIDDQMINNANLSKNDQEGLLRRRVNTWSQIEMLATRLNNMFTNDNYLPEFTKHSDLAIEYELTREENRQLRAANRTLEETMLIIADANNQIVERVTNLATTNTNDLRQNMRRISSSLTSLGLSEQALATRALRFSDSVVGAAINPLVFDAKADPKYRELAEKIDLWQGLARARAILPIGAPVQNARITSPYGRRTHPIDGEPAMHRGIDFAGAIGTPLLAVSPGRVVFTGERTGYGKTVELDHGLGFTTLYAHLSRISVERGENVKARQVVGLAGNTGRSTAPHLHYEIRFNGRPFNPYNFVMGVPPMPAATTAPATPQR
ncbi:MAG: M23 family metallopeptidase [Alphaproteobacteria bacterium]|nr:M23 family metallopeptidase [Alphaproteobacteria bacterium]